MEILDILQNVGLNEKEASVYMALLELGTATVHPIATKAGIKRPTTYLILEQLQQKGMVSIVPRATKALYTAESPEKILNDLYKKQELVKRFLPNMLAIYNAKTEKPQVLLFEGKEGVKEVYDKVLKAKKVDFFATVRDFVSFYPEFADKLKEKTKAGELEAREILTRNKADVEYAKTVEHSPYYEQKFSPPEQEFLTDNILFDNTVVFVAYQPYIFAVMLQSKSIYQSLKTLFELAWQASEPYEKIIK